AFWITSRRGASLKPSRRLDRLAAFGSMNYYPFHLGDYAAHTAHLEPLEDLAYRRMLDFYYLRETPLPSDPREVARVIRMRQNMDEVEAVLSEFFQLGNDGWAHVRCDQEIA